MSEELKIIKELGLAKVCEETHIAKRHIQALIDEDYSILSKVQFLGFISILERDYHIDLSEFKARGLEYYIQIAAPKVADAFIDSRPKKSSKGIYIFIVLAIFAGVTYLSIDFSSTTSDTKSHETQSVVQEIEALVEENTIDQQLILDNNVSEVIQESQELNATTQETPSEVSQPVVAKAEKIKIIVQKKTWFGYIDLATQTKDQKVFSNTFELDGSKDWLMRMGHKSVKVEIDGKEQVIDTKKSMQFLYKDGLLTQISLSEFAKLNEGKEW